MAERLSPGDVQATLDARKTLYGNGVLAIYSGPQPANAGLAETGTLLCLITRNSGAFTPGSAANGLNFGTPSNGVMDKSGAEVWSGTVLANGVAGYFRFYDNNRVMGVSSVAKRFDGAVSTGTGAELVIRNTTLIVGVPLIIDALPITQPSA